MATVRISSDWGHPQHMEWCGAPFLDGDNRIDRSLDIPEEAYQQIEAGIAQGYGEGLIYLDGGARFQWFLDGQAAPHSGGQAHPPANKNVKPSRSQPDSGKLIDVAAISDRPGEPFGGWVLGQFPTARPSKTPTCPHCGEPLAGHKDCKS